MIESVGSRRVDESDERDLGEVGLLPALVNAHTHLEFSALDRPLHADAASPPLARWIDRLIAYRQQRDSGLAGPSAHEAISMGLDE